MSRSWLGRFIRSTSGRLTHIHGLPLDPASGAALCMSLHDAPMVSTTRCQVPGHVCRTSVRCTWCCAAREPVTARMEYILLHGSPEKDHHPALHLQTDSPRCF